MDSNRTDPTEFMDQQCANCLETRGRDVPPCGRVSSGGQTCPTPLGGCNRLRVSFRWRSREKRSPSCHHKAFLNHKDFLSFYGFFFKIVDFFFMQFRNLDKCTATAIPFIYSFSGNICFKFSAFCLCSVSQTFCLAVFFHQDFKIHCQVLIFIRILISFKSTVYHKTMK